MHNNNKCSSTPREDFGYPTLESEF